MKKDFRYDKSRYDSSKKQKFQECMEYILEHTYGNSLMNTALCEKLGYNIDDKEEFQKFKSMMGE